MIKIKKIHCFILLIVIAMSYLFACKHFGTPDINIVIVRAKMSKPSFLGKADEISDRNVNTNFKNIDPAKILSQSNGIIFLETTNRTQPSDLVLCALESAALVYPERPIVFFMKGLPDINSEDDENRIRNGFPTLSSFKNIYFFPLKLEEVFKDTPLHSWYQKIDPKQENYWTHVSADGCRVALIWKHGGIYMDTDFVSLRPIPYRSFLAAKSSELSSNGIFGLPPHHNFAWNCMEDFVQNYNGPVWGHQGPQLFSRVLRKFCDPQIRGEEDIMCGNISFLNRQHFYPIPYPSWERYYQVWDKIPSFDNCFSLHLWNFMNKGKKVMVPGSNTLAENIYKQYCPNIHEALTRNMSIFM